MDKALAARFPGATGLITDPDPTEYVLDREAIARQGLKVEDVEGTIREALLATGLIDAVYTQAQLVGPRPAGDPFFDLHQRAFFAPRSGDLVARVKKYVYLGGYVGGTGHGTPYDYDRHVPIVFLGPGITPGPARRRDRTRGHRLDPRPPPGPALPAAGLGHGPPAVAEVGPVIPRDSGWPGPEESAVAAPAPADSSSLGETALLGMTGGRIPRPWRERLSTNKPSSRPPEPLGCLILEIDCRNDGMTLTSGPRLVTLWPMSISFHRRVPAGACACACVPAAPRVAVHGG